MDISPDGETLYIAVLDENSNPQILTMAADLTETAEVSYDPGTGTSINVITGKLTDLVWAGGDFGTEKIVRYSDVLGQYWTDVDGSQYFAGAVQPFMLGPGDDELVLAVINAATELRETYFVGEQGPYWLTLTDVLPWQVNALDRLSIDEAQIIIGSYFYNDNAVAYFTPNFGITFADISLSLLGANKNVTSVIFGYNY